MDIPPVLVSASEAILHLNLEHGTYRELLPYPGCLLSTPDHLLVARNLNEQTRLDLHDRQGLVWMRRLPRCFDTHSLALRGPRISDGFAVCSTGTNEVLLLDADGREQERWTPDPTAEFDSWHLNSLTQCDGKLFLTCFGRFARFRGWHRHVPGSGLLVDLQTRQTPVTGLSAPHDPYRLEGGWLVNDSNLSRFLFVPDGGKPKVLATAPGFSRGLAVLPQHYVVGFSSPRDRNRQEGLAAVLVLDRRTLAVVKTIHLPYLEIGHICAAPAPEVLSALQREQSQLHENLGLYPQRGVVPPEDRAGSIEVLEPARPSVISPGAWEVLVRVNNQGRSIWSTCHEPPVHLSFQVVDRDGNILLGDGQRTPLPVPIYPGTRLSLPMYLGMPPLGLPRNSELRLTLVQETVAWWDRTALWQPVRIPLPRDG
jgi:hypothetical protein